MQEKDHELDDFFFGYLEDGERDNMSFKLQINEEEEEEINEKENKNFWQSQNELLEKILCRSSLLETRIRKVTKESLEDIQMSENTCSCVKHIYNSNNICRNCLMREVSNRLRSAGFDSSVCRSKWRSSSHISSGEHRFIDVVDKSSSKRGEVRVIIELNFRPEFEIARPNREYNRLVNRLPQVFVAKAERLSSVIKILCTAAKKCMKEKKMHLGPWREHKYMQAKWLGACECFNIDRWILP